jgi:hypothetical protein
MSLTPEEIARGLTLTVPMPPNISNGSHGHWRTRHRQKKDYWGELDLLASMYGSHIFDCGPHAIPAPPDDPYPRATIRSTMYLGSAMDDSNAMRRHKWIEDWLVTRGYIADDRKKCLQWETFPEQIIKRDGNYRVVITLTPSDSH